MNWRSIPHFLDMFDDGCVIHLIRDPRAVFSSWKKLSSIPNYAYLNCILIGSTQLIISQNIKNVSIKKIHLS